MNNSVLAGIKAIDFGRYIAGPTAAMLLGDFGADVIRVELLPFDCVAGAAVRANGS